MGRIWEDLKGRENMIKNILYEKKLRKKTKRLSKAVIQNADHGAPPDMS